MVTKPILLATMLSCGLAHGTTTWTNALADGDINNAGNWSAGLPSDAAGLGIVVNATPLVVDKPFNNGGDNRDVRVTNNTKQQPCGPGP